jgi:Tfp pilus assembly protein PilX
LLALSVLVFLSLLGASLLAYVQARQVRAQLEVDRLQALYLAEAGIAHALREIRRGADFDGNGIGNIALTAVGPGRCRATHDFQRSTITATGESNQVQRTVEIIYSAL